MIKIAATRCHILRLKCTNSISAVAPPVGAKKPKLGGLEPGCTTVP